MGAGIHSDLEVFCEEIEGLVKVLKEVRKFDEEVHSIVEDDVELEWVYKKLDPAISLLMNDTIEGIKKKLDSIGHWYENG